MNPQQAILDILGEVLALSQAELDAITPDTHLADLGADSLDGPQIAVMIEEELDIDLPQDIQPDQLTLAQLVATATAGSQAS